MSRKYVQILVNMEIYCIQNHKAEAHDLRRFDTNIFLIGNRAVDKQTEICFV